MTIRYTLIIIAVVISVALIATISLVNVSTIPENPRPIDNEDRSTDRESTRDLPKVAIVLDDLGNSFSVDRTISNINLPITVAILPFRPDTASTSDFYSSLDQKEMILHLPMEPMAQDDIEDRMLMTDTTEEEIKEEFFSSFNNLGHDVAGLNNHKGSRFTSDPTKMREFLEIVQENDLYFFDSFTIGNSQGHIIAKDLGIPFAKRDVFLDNIYETGSIESQIDELLDIAEREGSAIAIGHSNPVTIQTLIDQTEYIQKRAEVVPLSELLIE